MFHSFLLHLFLPVNLRTNHMPLAQEKLPCFVDCCVILSWQAHDFEAEPYSVVQEHG